MWLIAAILSSFFAGLTSILAKCGIRKTDSDVAIALRTIVVLIFSWIMVLVVGSFDTITDIEGKSLLFLLLSGLATGGSWICYYKALSMADVNKVVPIDKSSTVLTVLMAIVLFDETSNLAVKLIGTFLIGWGVLLMIEKKPEDLERKGRKIEKGRNLLEKTQDRRQWIVYAVMSAVFAALTSILAKIGITGVESNLGTAIRTIVVLIMAWVIVFMKGKGIQVKTIDKKEFAFICFSGLATGASWLCYYYAIQNGIVSVVVPIDKLSILVSVGFSYIVFKEKLSKKAGAGLGMMMLGTIGIALFA